MSWRTTFAILSAFVGLAGCGGGESSTRVVTETLADGLNNPTAVIVNAEGSFLIAESGAGRIISVGTDSTVTPLVTGFEVGTYTPYDIGPLSLLQTSDGGLIVGEGGRPPGQEQVSFYGADGTPSFESVAPAGGGDYYGLAVQPSTGNLLIASAGTDRIFGAPPAEGGGFAEPVVIINDTTEEPIAAAAPSALAFDPDGLLYVGFAGEGSSGIVRIDTAISLVNTVVHTDSPVTGIAFRPSDSILFYTVLGEPERSSGTVFNIGTNGVATEFARQLDGPTALAFDSDDKLYVTTLGTPPNAAAGRLLEITIEEIVDEEPTDEEPADSNSTSDNES